MSAPDTRLWALLVGAPVVAYAALLLAFWDDPLLLVAALVGPGLAMLAIRSRGGHGHTVHQQQCVCFPIADSTGLTWSSGGRYCPEHGYV